MPHFSAVFTPADGTWSGVPVDLTRVESMGEIDAIVHEAIGESAILCIESEDEWFAILRFEAGEEVRLFLSDVQAALEDELAALLAADIGVAPENGDLGVHPVGDFDLLADFGLADDELTELSLEEGVLPADTLSVIAERLGFADEHDRLR